MTDQDQININLQRQIDAQTARIDNVLTKVDMLIAESQQQREDIRRAQEKHDADMKDMNARFDAKFDKIDAKFDTIDAKFDRLSEQIHTMTIAAVVGFGAIAAAVGSLIIAKFK